MKSAIINSDLLITVEQIINYKLLDNLAAFQEPAHNHSNGSSTPCKQEYPNMYNTFQFFNLNNQLNI